MSSTFSKMTRQMRRRLERKGQLVNLDSRLRVALDRYVIIDKDGNDVTKDRVKNVIHN